MYKTIQTPSLVYTLEHVSGPDLSLFQRFPHCRSLVHQCLRTLALHWEELAEYEQHYLPTIPTHQKEMLLSYLSQYGSQGCLDFKSFKILLQNEKAVEGGSGSEDVRFLDLTGLLNSRYTLSDLGTLLAHSFPAAGIIGGIAELSIGSQEQGEKALVNIIESWEDEDNEPMTNVELSQINVPVFSNLTRLSLARPGSWASWADLLTLSTKLNTLTHLSLAYWPRPSTTPNATTTFMISKHTKPVSLGGSHFYSNLDDDWMEATNIMRRLSLNTYCLKWLDLEGCTWHRALTWNFPSTSQRNGASISGQDEWVRASSSPGPDWNTAWRQIEYLNLYQGWIPANRPSLQGMPAGMIPIQLLRWLRENERKEEVQDKLNREGGFVVSEWVEREKVAWSVADEIHRQRKMGEGVRCVVDYGWEPTMPVKLKTPETRREQDLM